ncbi:MAG: hypothetical protein HQL40_19180, partial [Alphaproteobacteria bacterium]|nr:hypothetical protein [Alphaproteobacteria bacterium]
MKVLVTIPHDPRTAADTLRRQILGLRGLFASGWYVIDYRDGLKVSAPSFPTLLRVVVCTAGADELPDGLPVGAFEHRREACAREHLGFACHRVLTSEMGNWDIYAYLEDDLFIEDAAFFAKIEAFNRRVGEDWSRLPVLLPQRYEAIADGRMVDGPVSRLYLDYGVGQKEVAGPRVLIPGFAADATLEPSSHPHAGCFFLDERRLRAVSAHPAWGTPRQDGSRPVDWAPTQAVGEALMVYKPAIGSFDFLEIRRGHADAIRQIHEVDGLPAWRPDPTNPAMVAIFDRFLSAGNLTDTMRIMAGCPRFSDQLMLVIGQTTRRIALDGAEAAVEDARRLARAQIGARAVAYIAAAVAQTLLGHGAPALARAVLDLPGECSSAPPPRMADVIRDVSEFMVLSGNVAMASAFGDLWIFERSLGPRAAELHLMNERPRTSLDILDQLEDGPAVTVLRGLALHRMGDAEAAARCLERGQAEHGPTREAMAAQVLLDLQAGRDDLAGRRLLDSLRDDIPSLGDFPWIGDQHVFVAACVAWVERAFGDPRRAEAKKFYRTILDERPDYWPAFHIWTLYARCLGPAAPPGQYPDILLNNRGAKGGSAVQPILFDGLAAHGYSFAPLSDKPADMARLLGTEGPIAQWAHLSPDSIQHMKRIRPDRRFVIVEVIRDPRDALMSVWGRGHPGGLENAPPPDLATVQAVEMPIDLWAVAQPDVLVVKLEDVRRDPERELRRILE